MHVADYWWIKFDFICFLNHIFRKWTSILLQQSKSRICIWNDLFSIHSVLLASSLFYIVFRVFVFFCSHFPHRNSFMLILISIGCNFNQLWPKEQSYCYKGEKYVWNLLFKTTWISIVPMYHLHENIHQMTNYAKTNCTLSKNGKQNMAWTRAGTTSIIRQTTRNDAAEGRRRGERA